ncbi:uroporphyrinogen-III synthase [Mycetocola tolaasinivorans]|uniref:Uroporphyrinogen-III synthase n=1 Tax=Mycetocola tolaasinivorans TaxID=76635 RepID=A0A3L7AAH1_9MICO|nr:uroporphyrinogen-III synthase [Mycetocola tolaasinivorans]RLP76800.1 uroporphyrinogen-III synthase [Mycetocola tolaasinivorans]
MSSNLSENAASRSPSGTRGPRTGVPAALGGRRVLVPRDGRWGVFVAESLAAHGARAVIAPVIDFEPAPDAAALEAALEALARGEFDWVTVTSATTVRVLRAHAAVIPAGTRVAAVGIATAAALEEARYGVNLVPPEDHTARGMVACFGEPGVSLGRVLVLDSALAGPTLVDGLTALGADVTRVHAYRTIPVDLSPEVRTALARGDIAAILVTSGSVAAQFITQVPDLAASVVRVSIGDRTTEAAEALGLAITCEAPIRSVEGMITALETYYEVVHPDSAALDCGGEDTP